MLRTVLDTEKTVIKTDTTAAFRKLIVYILLGEKDRQKHQEATNRNQVHRHQRNEHRLH